MKKFQKEKRKNDPERFFANNDCKVGTKFKHTNGVNTLEIIWSHFCGIDSQNDLPCYFNDIIIKDLVIKDENGNLYRTLFHYPTYVPTPYTEHGEVNITPIPDDLARDIKISNIFNDKKFAW